MEKKCEECEQILMPRPGKTKVHKNRRFCDIDCSKKFYRKNNLEKMRAYMRRYLNKRYATDANHRAYVKKSTYKYRETSKGKEYIRKYNNRPEVKERDKKWREENSAELKEKKKIYMKEYLKTYVKPLKKSSKQSKSIEK